MKKIQNSYKKSGVNISIANKFVDHIAKISKKNVKKTDKSFNADNIGADTIDEIIITDNTIGNKIKFN